MGKEKRTKEIVGDLISYEAEEYSHSSEGSPPAQRGHNFSVAGSSTFLRSAFEDPDKDYDDGSILEASGSRTQTFGSGGFGTKCSNKGECSKNESKFYY